MSARLKRLLASVHRGRVLRTAALLGVVLAAGASVTALQWVRMARAAQTLAREQSALQATRASAEATHALSADLVSREAVVRELRGRGFMAEADRVAWVEAVRVTVERLRPVSYRVEAAAESSLPLPPSMQSWYDERGLAAPRLATNELLLELEGLHEGEVLAVVAKAQEAGGGIVRLESCRLERRLDATLLSAACTLRRFALLAPLTAGAPT